MATLGDGGPPETIPAVPHLVVDYEDISNGEVIGQGGSADVYRASVQTGEQTVPLAIKQPRLQGTLHRDTIEAFQEEAETWDRLDDHDHIVSVVDWGGTPLPWLAMEYMDGGSLDALLEDGKLPLRQALWVGLCVCRAVRYAHRHGVAHHDIKPANVLFRTVENGWMVPKVSDWGLARLLIEESKSIQGLSPHYAAPEQFDTDTYGSPDDITDIYQLGVLLYELTTGAPPFEGPATAVMQSILTEDPDPPSAVADVPEAIDELVMPALEKQKSDRYESVLYLRDGLESLLDSYPGDRAGGISKPSTLSDRPTGRESMAGAERMTETAPESEPEPKRVKDSELKPGAESTTTGRLERKSELGSTAKTTDTEASEQSMPDESTTELTDRADNLGLSRRTLLAAGTTGVVGIAGISLFLTGDDDSTNDPPDSDSTNNPPDSDSNEIEEREITYGIMMPETGDLGPLGGRIRDGARLPAKQIEGETPLTFNVVIEDTQTDSQAAISAANSMIDAGVPAVVGPAASNITLQVGPQSFIPNEVVGISPSSTAPGITDLDDNGYIFRTASSDALQGPVIAQAAMDEFDESDTVSTLYLDDDYAQSLEEEFVSAFEANHEGQAVERVSFEPEQSSYATEVDTAMGVDPDFLLIVCFPRSGIQLFHDFYDNQDDESPIIVPDGLIDSEFSDDVGNPMNNVWGIVPTADGPGADAFAQLYEEEWGEEPTVFNSHAYDAAAVVMLANARAGENDGTAIRDNIREVANPPGETITVENLAEGLKMAARDEDIQYEGASSSTVFDENGDMTITPYDLVRYENGELTTLRTINFGE